SRCFATLRLQRPTVAVVAMFFVGMMTAGAREPVLPLGGRTREEALAIRSVPAACPFLTLPRQAGEGEECAGPLLAVAVGVVVGNVVLVARDAPAIAAADPGADVGDVAAALDHRHGSDLRHEDEVAVRVGRDRV